ncbi:hypothetical protein [Spirosoma agri]
MNSTGFSYNGFLIRPRTVLGETSDRIAFEIVNSDGQILGTYGSAERAKKLIDRNGTRWLKQR